MRLAALLLLAATALGAPAAIVLQGANPSAAGIDPQGTLAGGILPVGACARLSVTGGDRVLSITGSSSARIGVTQQGGPAVTVTTEKIVNHLLGDPLLTGTDLEAADLDDNGRVEAADLVRIVLFGGSLFTGGDPFALICASPDGDGPLNDGSGLTGYNLTVREDGDNAGSLTVQQVANVMSLVPYPDTVLPGGTFLVALQIGSDVDLTPTVAYRARIFYDPAVLTPTGVTGANRNDDFDGTPDVVHGVGHIEVSDSVTSRTDLGAAVINVANISFTLSASAQPLTFPAFVFDQTNTSLTPQGQSPIFPGILGVSVVGAAIRVGP